MKRFGCLLLVLCLLSGCVLAERAPMKLWDVDEASAFWREHRDIAHERVLLSPWDDRLTGFCESEVDVAILRLYHHKLQPFVDADVLADLSESAFIRESVSRMPAWIRNQVTTQDGRIIALPTRALVRTVNWYQDAWDAAGLTEEDVPRSFTELLDFLDAWTPHEQVCVSRLVRWGGPADQVYTRWLMDMLLVITETQQRYVDQPITFDTPQFIQLAERCRRIGLALYESEPSQQKRENMLQLFQNDLSGGEHANNGRAYGLSHCVPLRLTNDQPALARIMLEAHVIRKGSPWLKEGLGLLESILQNKPWYFQYALYTDFEAGDYRYDNGATGRVDEGWLNDYHSYEGEFVFFPRIFDTLAQGTIDRDALIEQFCAGKLSASELAQKLDELIH